MNKTLNNFKACDIYGHPIGVHYQGESKFNTLGGSLATLLTTAIMISYASI